MENSNTAPQESSQDLPVGAELFSHQAAGHKHGQGRLGIGVLKHTNGDILKPMFEGDRRAGIELAFYKKVFQPNQSEALLQELACFLPAFHGIWETSIGGKDIKYLCLEDVCTKFENPSVLDLKMGRRTYDDDANQAKILSQSTKFKYGEAIGIRILGMKVYSNENKTYLPQNEKTFWRQLNPETITSGLNMYLTNNKHINTLILCGFIHKLVQLNCWFSHQRLLKFIGSSLLFVYEGTFSAWSFWFQQNQIDTFCSCSNFTELSPKEKISSTKSNLYFSDCQDNSNIKDICDICGLCKNICSNLTNCNLFRVVMIDFSHCFSSEEEDVNYTFGLKKLISYLKDLLKMQ